MEGDVVHLAVEDNGIGIDVARLDRLMLPFRVGVPGRSPGPGIGLALAQRIARRHGSDLQASSEGGEGSTLSVALTLAPVAP